jgi:AcrR family transcriptional regulator
MGQKVKMSDERSNRILDATRKLLIRYGYDKTTVSDIAREAGISKGAVYLEFRSKDALVHALMTHDIYAYSEHIFSVLERLAVHEWTFSKIYQVSIDALVNSPMMKAIVRNDKRVFGAYMTGLGQEWVQYKQQGRYPMLLMMQQAGAIRQELDAKIVDYILSLIVHGVALSETDNFPYGQVDEQTFITTLGDMLDHWLLPADGGNREASRAIILALIKQFNERKSHAIPRNTDE